MTVVNIEDEKLRAQKNEIERVARVMYQVAMDDIEGDTYNTEQMLNIGRAGLAISVFALRDVTEHMPKAMASNIIEGIKKEFLNNLAVFTDGDFSKEFH